MSARRSKRALGLALTAIVALSSGVGWVVYRKLELPLAVFHPGFKEVGELAFAGDGAFLALFDASHNSPGELWTLDGSSKLAIPDQQPRAFSTKGELVAFADNEGVKLWSVSQGRVVRSVNNATNVNALALSPDESLVAESIGQGSGALNVVSSFDGETVAQLDSFAAPYAALCFTPDGRAIQATYSTGGGGRVEFSIGSGKRTPVVFYGVLDGLVEEGTFSAVQGVSGSGRVLAKMMNDQVQVAELSPTRRIRRSIRADRAKKLALSYSGDRLAIAFADGHVEVWEIWR